MAQMSNSANLSNSANENRNPNVVPIGPGGVAGSIFRKIVMVCTAGFVYPNSFVEGMDLTVLDKRYYPDKS